MPLSILQGTKKVLGIGESDTAFDQDIIMHINSVFSTLNQVGVGPVNTYSIETGTEQWSQFLAARTDLNFVKSYLYLKVRLLFDPPTTSFALESMNKQASEFEWRLNVQAERTLT